jgi:hypothetical protein
MNWYGSGVKSRNFCQPPARIPVHIGGGFWMKDRKSEGKLKKLPVESGYANP